MTELVIQESGASSAEDIWNAINWQTVYLHVKRLQVRIAKATREKRWGRVKALQRLLTCSYYAKLLAIKRVTENRGGKTPGIDNIVWKTPKQKIEAAISLRRMGYCTKPLKRIYIPKKNKKLRPLSIPCMADRGMQGLYLLALEPVVEMIADKNSYGFRPKRSAADAIEQCFNSLARKGAAQFILEGDIKSCFDSISQIWLENNIVIDKVMLKKWFTAGYIDKGKLYQMENGTSQGSPISPTILNATMSSLEQAIEAVSKLKDKVHIITYADDFIITGATKEVLEEKVKPVVVEFLKTRGLELSIEKTKISHIQEGFDFLGFNIRKYKDKLFITPSKSSQKRFLDDIRETIKSNPTAKTENLILQLNSKILGWGNYFSHVVSKKVYSRIDHCIFKTLWNWAKRRHRNKNIHWVKNKYFQTIGMKNWMFYAKLPSKDGKPSQNLNLVSLSNIPIKRHVKIRNEATPYDHNFKEYFQERARKRTIVEKPDQSNGLKKA